MSEFLLELLSEEIPARMQKRAGEDLQRLVTDALKAAGVEPASARAFATPRRLALVMDGLPDKTPDVKEERKGPKVGAPDRAIQGFLRAAGLASIDQATVQEDKKGAFYIAVTEKKGRATADLVAEIVPQVVRDFPWPKSMRSGRHDLRWVRPLHSILCLLGGKVVPFDIEGIKSGDQTRGHRFMVPQSFAVTSFADYEKKLEAAYVILDPAKRAAVIKDGALKLAAEAGLELVGDNLLLEEVAGLVEWPVPLIGQIDDEFMSVPQEVLTSTMRANQKYFACADANGKLAPRFIVVANLIAQDGGKAVVNGNERVLRARFADARFLWDQDRKVKLGSRLPKLEEVVFQAKLGTVRDKAERIAKLARELAAVIPGVDPNKAEIAGRLAKADLTSGMVREFPELQGIMGSYFADEENLGEDISISVAQHYSPAGPDDFVPTSPLAQIVSLADKIDTLVGFWLLTETPTGSRDPFALRRAALGVIRITLEQNLRISLAGVITFVVGLYVWMGLKPGPYGRYITLAAYFEPEESGPGISWSEPPYRTLLDYDGFISRNSDDIGYAQIGQPNEVPDIDEVEMRDRVRLLDDLRERLEALDNLAFSVEGRIAFADDEYARANAFQAFKEPENAAHLSQIAALTVKSLVPFFADRLKVYLRDRGARHDLVDAVFALPGQDDLVLIVKRVEALSEFLATEDGKNLLAGYKRAVNILNIEEKKDKASYGGEPDPALFAQDEERTLFDRIEEARAEATHAVGREDFAAAMHALAKLRAPVDAFFEKVTVNTDDADVRANRLRLLALIRAALHEVADFSKVEG